MDKGNRYSISVTSLYEIIFCLMSTCYTLNLFGCYKYISYLVLAIVAVAVIAGRTISLSLQTLIVSVFLIIYDISAQSINGVNKAPMLLQCAIFYIAGMRLSRYAHEHNKINLVFRVFLWGAIGFVMHTVLTVISSSITFDRRLTDFSDGGLVAATQLIAWCVIFFAMFPWTVLRWKTLAFYEKTLFGIFTVLGVSSSFIVSSRTGIVVFGVAAILLILWLIKERKTKIIWLIITILVVGVIAFQYDICGFKTAIFKSNLAERLISENTSMFETPRTQRWKYLFEHYREYMWGGYHFSSMVGGQLHSILLDLYDESGIIVTVLFFFILIRQIHGSFRLLKNDTILFPDNIGMVLWFLIVSIVLFSEPIWYYGRHMMIGFVFFAIGCIEYNGFFAGAKRSLSE